MRPETVWRLLWQPAGHQWVTDHGVQRRRGSSPGVLHHKTCTLFLFSLLLHVCQSRRREYDPDGVTVFMPAPVNVTAERGTMAVLPCVVAHLGSKKVAWRRVEPPSNHFLTLGNEVWDRQSGVMLEAYREGSSIFHNNLLIKNVNENHSGIYECHVTDMTKPSRNVTLTVIDPPVKEPAISMQGKKYVEKGQPIELKCTATGGAQIPEAIDWFKDGVKVDTQGQSHMVITRFRSIEKQAFISELTINHSREEDKGTYICRSTDGKIDSIIVNILVADSKNVKRDNNKPKGSSGSESSSSPTWRKSCTIWPLLSVALASGYLFT